MLQKYYIYKLAEILKNVVIKFICKFMKLNVNSIKLNILCAQATSQNCTFKRWRLAFSPLWNSGWLNFTFWVVLLLLFNKTYGHIVPQDKFWFTTESPRNIFWKYLGETKMRQEPDEWREFTTCLFVLEDLLSSHHSRTTNVFCSFHRDFYFSMCSYCLYIAALDG